jgi:hypothetical protein
MESGSGILTKAKAFASSRAEYGNSQAVYGKRADEEEQKL